MGLLPEFCTLCQLVDEEFDAGFPVVSYAVVLALYLPDVVLFDRDGDLQVILVESGMVVVWEIEDFDFSDLVLEQLLSSVQCKSKLILTAVQPVLEEVRAYDLFQFSCFQELIADHADSVR